MFYRETYSLTVCFVVLIMQLFSLSVVCSIRQSNLNQYHLHKLMNESELNYYFSTNLRDFIIPEYEVITINMRIKRSLTYSTDDYSKSRHILNFKAFNKSIHLHLKPNSKLISPHINIALVTENGQRSFKDLSKKNSYKNMSNENCLFLHNDENINAALHNCHDKKYFEGIILLPNMTLEIRPINERLLSKLPTKYLKSTYMIKKAVVPEFNIQNRTKRSIKSVTLHVRNKSKKSTDNKHSSYHTYRNKLIIAPFSDTRISRQVPKLVIEVGVFFDEVAYKAHAPIFNYNEEKITDLLLAYMNGVQALYHHSSLGISIDISIVHLEIMRKQPKSLPTHNGEKNKLLDSFCEYQRKINIPDDNDPNHWDVALYLTGLDLYSFENGYNSSGTLGLATVRSVCYPEYSCVVVEFGVDNSFGRPFPSAGFNSIFVLAHELGHSLGMHHDSSGNNCPKEGYIMSPTRGTQGETSWSTCSAKVAKDLLNWATCLKDNQQDEPPKYNAWKYLGYPGQFWSNKQQCEVLLREKDAYALPVTNTSNIDICQNLYCKSPHKSGFFFAGPALEGSVCGDDKWCVEGNCSQKTAIYKPHPIITGGWSPWKYEKCQSGCIKNSKGYQNRRRYCDSPKPVNSHEGCEGLSYDSILCNDKALCRNSTRFTVEEFASLRCKDFSKDIHDLDPEGVGLQAPHEANRIWMGCAIFCKRKSSGIFYTPRFELNDLGQNAYFPDGTWCHQENGENYYCIQHHCLPKGFNVHQSDTWLRTEDIPVSGNAVQNLARFSNPKIIDYLSLDNNGKPILKHIKKIDVTDRIENNQWADDNDFRIIKGL